MEEEVETSTAMYEDGAGISTTTGSATTMHGIGCLIALTAHGVARGTPCGGIEIREMTETSIGGTVTTDGLYPESTIHTSALRAR